MITAPSPDLLVSPALCTRLGQQPTRLEEGRLVYLYRCAACARIYLRNPSAPSRQAEATPVSLDRLAQLRSQGIYSDPWRLPVDWCLTCSATQRGWRAVQSEMRQHDGTLYGYALGWEGAAGPMAHLLCSLVRVHVAVGDDEPLLYDPAEPTDAFLRFLALLRVMPDRPEAEAGLPYRPDQCAYISSVLPPGHGLLPRPPATSWSWIGHTFPVGVDLWPEEPVLLSMTCAVDYDPSRIHPRHLLTLWRWGAGQLLRGHGRQVG